jgi:competence protein ComEC
VAVATYIAGLLVGLDVGPGARMALTAVALATTAVLAIRARRISALLAAIGATALIVATLNEQSSKRCSATFGSASSWTVEVGADAGAGELLRGTARAGNCVVPAVGHVWRGVARAGEVIEVRGTGYSGERGLFIENAEIIRSAPSGMMLRVRTRVGRRIDRIFGTDAPMVRALVIADMNGIPQDVRDRYARAGIVHMLSVSGLHVGIVAVALELLASLLRLPLRPARLATLGFLAVYVAAIGAPPPAVRAAVMLGALLLSRLTQRPTSRWAILALGALAPLWDTRTVLDLGWQLSVAGTAALISGSALAARVMPRKWSGWKVNLVRATTISIVATAATAPLVAWTFGRVSLVGPFTNLLADPVMAIVQPLLFVAVAVPIPFVEHLSADASHALLAAFDGVGRIGASIPGGSPMVVPTVFAACAAAFMSLALLRACSARDPWRAVLAGATALTALVLEPLVPTHSGVPELHMIDVGQGDALALRTSGGRWIVIDAGRSWLGGDAGKSTLVPYLAHRGGAVAAFILSHPHADHVGGAVSLFTALHPARFIDPGYVGTTPPYRAALTAAQQLGIAWQRVHAGDSLVIDDVVLRELAPDSAWAAQLHDPNLASTVLSVRVAGYRVLFTGDAEAPEEAWLLEHDPEMLAADVLKVGHHGSITSSTPEFLDAVHARIALISVGAHNTYGHPDQPTLDALHARNATILRTDLLGNVVLRFARDGIHVSTRSEDWIMARQAIPCAEP